MKKRGDKIGGEVMSGRFGKKKGDKIGGGRKQMHTYT